MSPRFAIPLCTPVVASILLFTACSGTLQKQTRVYSSGEKIQVARLTYSVVDVQIQPVLPGQDATNPRIPQNRFYTLQIAVSNGGNEDTAIPALALVDDAGHVFNELPDGSGVVRWLGMVRRGAPGQTGEGSVLFDAPPAPYRLSWTGDTEDAQ